MSEFQYLEPGNRIEAWDKTGTRWQGTVDMADPDLGVIWIHTDVGERKLLDFHEHTILAALPVNLQPESLRPV